MTPPIAATSQPTMRELTLRSVFIGLVLSMVMGAANVYLGLKAGMTVSASIPAAVVGVLLLRLFFGAQRGTILEANQIQTAASAGESLAAGVIFTMPALVLIGAWQQFDMLVTTAVAFTGGLLGILFMIPMRRVFVIKDNPELKFPEGVACAAVLKVSEQTGGGEAMSVVQGSLIGAGFKVLISFVGLFKGTLEGAMTLGERILYFGGDVSPALLAVGVIVRLNVALLIFIGGAISWLIGIPILGRGGEFTQNALDGAWTLWSTQMRYVGVGAMVVGGMASIIKVRHGLVEAVRQLKGGAPVGSETVLDAPPDTDRDLSSKTIVGLSVLAVCLVMAVYFKLTGSVPITIATTIIMIVMSFFFTAVASYIVGLVGNSNSPVSGMTITAVLFTGALLLMFGFAGMEGMVATLGVAAIVCCAACTSGDVCNDLKTGHMVGASPYRQQIMQIAGVAVASLVMAPVMQLLHENTPGGIGGRELSAPQAGLFASLARGFFGDEALPWNMVGIGAAIGVLILLLDRVLEKRQSTFRAHLMPIAVGMYLPFGLAPPILLGGLLAYLFAAGTDGDAQEKRLGRSVLFASGAIAGESLTGVGLAVLVSLGITPLDLQLSNTVVMIMTAVGALALVGLFYRLSQPRDA
ncbi:MAG: oligopeptide transporter, OPT family [Myxococcota bacterium]